MRDVVFGQWIVMPSCWMTEGLLMLWTKFGLPQAISVLELLE